MKLAIKYITTLIVLMFFAFACSDIEENLAPQAEVNIHKEGISDPASPNFHGRLLGATGFNGCSQCHASDLSGGVTGSACNTTDCHPSIDVHQTGILDPSSTAFHAKYIKGINWELDQCATCHGTDYGGGYSAGGCNTTGCHTAAEGPEACNTCHGDPSDQAMIAPPQDLLDNSEGTIGIGAHTAHLTDAAISDNVACIECHTVPSSLNSPGHLDATAGAELIFGTLSTTVTNVEGTQYYDSDRGLFSPAPAYDMATGTCSGSYCHGNFKNGNTDNVVSWTAGSDGAKCGSCHGDPDTGDPLPGGSHFQVATCESCHAAVVTRGADGLEFVAPEKHINGKLNVFGTEIDY